MKRNLFLLAVFAILIVFSGCTAGVKNLLSDNGTRTNIDIGGSINVSGGTVADISGSNVATSNQIVVTTTPKKTVQRFYPEDLSPKVSASDDAGTASKGSSSSFSVTQELQVKLYLVDKYNPGICYGLPGPVPDQAVAGMLTDNPDLVKFLEGKYDLKTDMEIYKKIKQINGIHLSQEKGSYVYEFTDGQCCALHAYQGKITIMGSNITDTVLRQQTQVNPC